MLGFAMVNVSLYYTLKDIPNFTKQNKLGKYYAHKFYECQKQTNTANNTYYSTNNF